MAALGECHHIRVELLLLIQLSCCIVPDDIEVSIHASGGVVSSRSATGREVILARDPILSQSLVAGKCLDARNGTCAEVLYLEELLKLGSRGARKTARIARIDEATLSCALVLRISVRAIGIFVAPRAALTTVVAARPKTDHKVTHNLRVPGG